MTKIKATLKSVVKVTEKQLQSAPDLTGKIIVEGKEYEVAIFMNLNGATLYLTF